MINVPNQQAPVTDNQRATPAFLAVVLLLLAVTVATVLLLSRAPGGDTAGAGAQAISGRA